MRAEPGRENGDRSSVRYQDRTLEELRALAAKRDIYGRSSMNKDELIAALRQDASRGDDGSGRTRPLSRLTSS